MRSLTTLAALALSLSVSIRSAAAQAGHFEGQIQTPNRDLAIIVDLARNTSGAWIGSMSVAQSTSIDVPLRKITVDGSTVKFTTNLPTSTSFEGTLSADAHTIEGTVTGPRGSAPFKLARNGEADVKIPPASSALSKDFAGTWEGSLDVGGKIAHLGVKLAPTTDGTAEGALILLDEGGLEIPLSTVTVQGKELLLEARAVSGRYRGTLGASGEIAGEWTQGPGRFVLTLKRRSGGA